MEPLSDYSGTLVLFRETIRLPGPFDLYYTDRPPGIASLERNMDGIQFWGALSSQNRLCRLLGEGSQHIDIKLFVESEWE